MTIRLQENLQRRKQTNQEDSKAYHVAQEKPPKLQSTISPEMVLTKDYDTCYNPISQDSEDTNY